MRNCKDLMEHLSAYADGEYSGAEKRQMEAHLLSCKNCSELLKLYRDISRAKVESTMPAPRNLVNGVMERVHSDGARFEDRSKRHSRNRSAFARYAPIAACLVVVLLAIPFALPHILGQNETSIDAAPDEARMMALVEAPVAEMDADDSAPAPTALPPADAFDAQDEPAAEAEETGGWTYDSHEAFDAEDETTPEIAADWYEGGLLYYGIPIEGTDLLLFEDAGGLYIADEYGHNIFGLFQRADGLVDSHEQYGLPHFTTIVIRGELPELLEQYIPLDHEFADDGYIIYLITPETAQRLIDEMAHYDDFEFAPINIDGEFALVIFRP